MSVKTESLGPPDTGSQVALSLPCFSSIPCPAEKVGQVVLSPTYSLPQEHHTPHTHTYTLGYMLALCKHIN